MYPQTELTELARGKAELRQAIARRRAQCAAAASGATRPLRWLDTARTLWRNLSPLAGLAAWPLGAVAARAIFPGGKILRTLLRWAPPVFGAVAAFRRHVSQPVR